MKQEIGSQDGRKQPKSLSQILGIFFLIFCVFFVYAAESVPAVNESHYLLKAYVTYHPEPLQEDIFLGSADTHWLFFRIAGLLTIFCSLDMTAWILRIIGWSLVAYGWLKLVERSRLPLIIAPFLAAAWLCGMYYGQLSGEWVVGGIEAKVIAYAFLFIGWSYLFTDKPYCVWPWLGASAAFHVLVGGWGVVATAIALVLVGRKELRKQLKPHLLFLFVGGALSLPGLVPALQTTAGVTAAENAEAAQIYVYQRIPHHLCFSKFSEKRRTAFVIPLLGYVVAAGLFWKLGRPSTKSTSEDVRDESTEDAEDRNRLCLPNAGKWLALGAATLVLALVGIVIEQIGIRGDAAGWEGGPIFAAKLLKFYWFRLIDPVVPMSALFVVVLLAQSRGLVQSRNNRNSLENGLSAALWIGLIALGAWVLSDRFQTLMQTNMAEANFRSLPVRDKTPEEREVIYQDWLRVCKWVKENTPDEGLWLTPRHQQTFKWYTRRNELACWKDIPQDSKNMLEWWQRLGDAYQKDENDEWKEWSTERLQELKAKYGIRYVIVDRRIQEQPPLLPLLYPLNDQWNDTYAVFEIVP